MNTDKITVTLPKEQYDELELIKKSMEGKKYIGYRMAPDREYHGRPTTIDFYGLDEDELSEEMRIMSDQLSSKNVMLENARDEVSKLQKIIEHAKAHDEGRVRYNHQVAESLRVKSAELDGFKERRNNELQAISLFCRKIVFWSVTLAFTSGFFFLLIYFLGPGRTIATDTLATIAIVFSGAFAASVAIENSITVVKENKL